MQSDFDRAGEDAWLIGISYDFSHLGVEGLSAFAKLAVGHDARDQNSTERFSDQREFDLTVDYRFQKGWLRGLWLRARGSIRSVEGTARNGTQIRIIAHYEIPIL
jgi:hypothetical protein